MSARNMRKGLIPYPKFRTIYANKRENVGVNYLGARTERGTCWHRGLTGTQTIEGAVAWLNLPTTQGQTDFYIDHRTGEMIRMLPPLGSPNDATPWAQGPWNQSAASTDAVAFLNKYMSRSGGKGVSTWNSDLVSIEITGDQNTPISDATKATMVQWTAAQAHDLGIVGDNYPINADGVSILYGHREGCGVAYKACPFPVIWSYINSDEFIQAVRDLMNKYQLGGTVTTKPVETKPVEETTQYAPLILPNFVKKMLAGDETSPWVDSDNTRYYMVTDQYKANKVTPRLQTANVKTAKRVGPDMEKDEAASIAFLFTSKEDNQVYGLSNYGTCFLIADFDRVSDSAAK